MSVLTDTKKVLGLAEEYEVFDQDILMFINGALSDASQVGSGVLPIIVADSGTNWDQLMTDPENLSRLKNYIFLKAKSLFDPPPTSFAITAMDKQIEELEWRMRTRNEELNYVPEGEVV